MEAIILLLVWRSLQEDIPSAMHSYTAFGLAARDFKMHLPTGVSISDLNSCGYIRSDDLLFAKSEH